MTTDPASGVDTFGVGALTRSTANNFFDGEIAEIIAYKSALRDGQIARVEAYLTARYDL